MKTINYDTAPTIFLDAFEAPHGALLPDPIVLLDIDSLPLSHRIDKSLASFADINWTASPGSPFSTPWRSCTPGSPLVVAAVANCTVASLYVESSVDGITRGDSLCRGNLSAYTVSGLRFSTTRSFYRITVAVSEACKGSTWTQQRT